MIRERPIIFSAPMVRAIIDGCKTMTRRVVKPQPILLVDGIPIEHVKGKKKSKFRAIQKQSCPYGQPGNRLWVRETYCVGYEYQPGHFTAIPYQGCEKRRRAFYRATDDDAKDDPKRPWKPSIHMPRWASRITLELTGVRVERLQDINEEDAMAEGVNWKDYAGLANKTARKLFIDLWDSINAKDGRRWVDNPFVWVVSFKRVKP